MESFWPRAWAYLTSPLTLTIGLFVASIATGLAGTVWSYGPPGAAFVWWPLGLALGAFLIVGYRVWPVVAAANLIVGIAGFGLDAAVPILAVSRTAEPLLAAYLINRFASGRHALQSPRCSVRFAAIVVATAAITEAAIAGVMLAVEGAPVANEIRMAILAAALGSATSMLLLAPPIVLISRGRPHVRLDQAIEGAAALGVVAATGMAGFYELPVELRGFPVEVLLMPVLLWPALRLGRRATSIALLILAVLAIGGTLEGYGPFVRSTPLSSLAIALSFLAASATLTLALAALSSDYEVAEAQLRELVVTDALTGLPNYRKLVEVLEKEIGRADRLTREFAVVFFDMDDLKVINDELGHLAGSRAVCRFADTLRAALREADTAARYGGDEFVAVLPDTDVDGAALVLERFRADLAADTTPPKLTVSAGIAVYPRDGRTPTTLLATADRALYANKAQKSRARGRRVVDLQEWTSAS